MSAEDEITAGDSDWAAYDERLYGAIGRVAVSSAMLDEVLTELVDELAGTDIMWRITVGQSTDWLIQSLRLLLDETDPYFRRYTHEQHRTFLSLLDEAGRLRDLRNYVVHGLWTSESAFEEDARPRPWGETEATEAVFYSTRARNRKGYVAHAMTVGDALRLATEIARVRDGLVRLYRQMKPDWKTRRPPLARWLQDDFPDRPDAPSEPTA